MWCASAVGISENEARFTSTWDLERCIIERQFGVIWDKLDSPKRLALLNKIDVHNQIEDKAKKAALGFKQVQTALFLTAHFTGFVFYSSMTTTLATVAAWVGITVPFAAYQTMTSVIAVLAGPIGWAISAVMVAGSFAAWAGKADIRKTLATVMQIHSMNAGALYGANQID